MIPVRDPERAISMLRVRLRAMIADQRPDAAEFANLTVNGPSVRTDARGHQWFEWVGTVDVQPASTTRQPADDHDPEATVDDLGLLRRRTG